MAFEARSPFQLFVDAVGKPLNSGALYVGVANLPAETNPLQVYWDEAGTIPALQPLAVSGGYIVRNGSPARIYTTADDYSMTLKTDRGITVWSELSVTSALNLRNELASQSGSSMIGFIQSGLGANATTVQAKLRESVSVKDFGAVGDGVTDDTAAIQEAIYSLGAAGGKVIVTNGMRCLIDNNLTINPNVSLVGPHSIVGSPNNNLSAPYNLVGGALIVNSSATITVKGGASIKGMLIHRKGMAFPSSDSSLFSGTAITIGGDDAAIFQCMILGFAQAITSSNWQRPRIYDVNIDCGSGVLIDNCADISYISRVHCWPFATIAALGPASSLQRGGTAFRFTNLGDWNKITDCFSYGYFRGFWITSCNSMTLTSCSADSTGGFSGQIGLMADGGSTDTRFVSCQAAAQETGYRIATSSGVQTRMSDCDSWACSNQGVLVDSGDASIFGGIHRNTPSGITINNSSSAVNIDNVRFTVISGLPINAFVPNAEIRIGDNDYGNWPAGNPVTNNANRPVVSVASADPLNLPAIGSMFQVTGNNSFGALNGGWAGRLVVLKFTGALTVNDGGASLIINGNFTTTGGDTLTLIHDGVAWYEVSRSVN